MSELYSTSSDTSDTTQPAADVSHEPSPREPAQDGRSYSSQETTSTTRGDYGDLTEHEAALEGDDAGAYDDAELDAMLAEEERLPEPRTRQEARAETWDHDASSSSDEPAVGFGDSVADYDGDLDALLAQEENLPEPRTRQEARADTWGDSNGLDQDARTSREPGTSKDNLPETRVEQESPDEARPGTGPQADTASEATVASAESLSHPAHDEAADDASSPDQTRVVVHDQYGHDWPLTVVHLDPEDRTLGEGRMSGIGLKPTGEQLLEMEGDDPSESRTNRFFGKAFELMDDVHDATSHIAEAIQEDLPHGSAQQPSSHTSYVVHDQPTPPPDAPGAGDMIANLTVLGVMTAVGFRHLFGHRRKEEKA